MFTVLDNRRDLSTVRQNLLESLLRDCQQANQTSVNELIQYYFQTESPSAFLLIKQFLECGKDQTKILIEHLNNQGLKQNYRHSSSLSSIEAHQNDEQEKVAHMMKVFRILCLIIHRPLPGIGTLMKDTLLLTNCVQAIIRCKDDPSILAQGCYFFAALTATIPGEIVQHTDAILNIYKATCKYLSKNVSTLEQISIQTTSHSLENVQLWIVNQSVHALFYILYTTYPCNFLCHIQREYQKSENNELFENILIPMFQRVRFNPKLIDGDRKREIDKDRRLRQDSSQIVYEARKLSLDPLFGRESPTQKNWMHQEMKKILPFSQFKRQTPTNSVNQLFNERPNTSELSTPIEIVNKRTSSSPFVKIKEKIKSFMRSSSNSTPSTAISTPDPNGSNSTGSTCSVQTTNNNNTLMVPNVSSSILTTPTLTVMTDIRAVKTMPELQSNNDDSSSPLSSMSNIHRSDHEHQQYVRTVINQICSIYDQNLPSNWRQILSRYDPNLIVVETPRRQATFYVSPSEHSLDNQHQQQNRLQFDDLSPSANNEKRQRCASASCASSHHIHSPVLAAPTTSTDDILSRTQSLSTKQRTRPSGINHESSNSFSQRTYFEHPVEIEEDETILNFGKDSIDPTFTQIPGELFSLNDGKSSTIDEIHWNEHDFITVPHFDFNEIVHENSSLSDVKRFDRLYQCYSSYEVFLTDQYKKIWENLWAKQKSHQKNFNDLQTTFGFTKTLNAEIHRYLVDELKIYENQSKFISDENTLLGDKVVELSKITSRRQQSSKNEDEDKDLRELEKFVEQLRKDVNNETLKLVYNRLELERYENERKFINERLESLNLMSKNIKHLKELNEQAEFQYLRLSDEMSFSSINLQSSSFSCVDEDDQQHSKSTPSTTTNGRDENSEFDSISFNEENREDFHDQQQDENQKENYDELLNEIIEIFKSQNPLLSTTEIENRAYDLLLEYMQSKADMQNYLLEHNTRYSELFLEAQQKYIEQMELELTSSQSMLHQMQHVAI